MPTELQGIAGNAYDLMEVRERANGDRFWTVKDGEHAQWVRDLCQDAHGGHLPDDWRYEFIGEALSALADNEDPDEIALEADSHTTDLLAWLSSSLSRMAYCDEAAEDHGATDLKAGDGHASDWGEVWTHYEGRGQPGLFGLEFRNFNRTADALERRGIVNRDDEGLHLATTEPAT